MAHRPRKRSPIDIYHVILHTTGGCPLFCDDEDRISFLSCLRDALERSRRSAGPAPAALPSCALYAWCLMPDHVHLLVGMELAVLSPFVQGLAQRYARAHNLRHGRAGSLCAGRFKSEPVESREHFLAVVRHIHQNPAKALMTSDCRYAWSSFGEYLGRKGPTSAGPVLSSFGGIEPFLRFHDTLALDGRCLELTLRMSDEEARSYASAVIGRRRLEAIGRLGRQERDSCLRALKACRVPCAQIAAITPLSLSTVYRA